MNICRLMNVGLVRWKQGEQDVDLRPYCVEVTSVAHCSLIVMWSLYDKPYERQPTMEPRLIGRLSLPHPVRIVDAAEFDLVNWLVLGPNFEMVIRPHDHECIWVDQSFIGSKTLVSGWSDSYETWHKPSLADLYRDRRNCMYSLIVNNRLLRSTAPLEVGVRRMHTVMVETAQKTLTEIDRAISVARGGQHGVVLR